MQRHVKALVLGMGILPFGLYGGVISIALPFLLTDAGISLDRVASIEATAMSPIFWGFLLTPVVDVRLTRRAYCFLTVMLTAGCLTTALWMLGSQLLRLATLFFMMGQLSIVIYGNAAAGWMSEAMVDEERGAVSGWINVANGGAGGVASLIVLSLATRFSVHVCAVAGGLIVILPAAVLLLYPVPAKPVLALHQVFGDLVRTTLRLCKTRKCLAGFLLFLSPAGAAAGMNLFSGLGKDYRASSQLVIWVTGAGSAMLVSLGALVGGVACDRFRRRYVYLWAGVLISLCGITMALSPLSSWVLAAGVLVYSALMGFAYTAFCALGFELTGAKNPVASTQLALFAAAGNAAVTYMTWFDGKGYHLLGPKGLLLFDAAASGLSAAILLVVIGRLWQSTVEPAVRAVPAPTFDGS